MPKLHRRLAYYYQRTTMPGIFGTDAAAAYVHTGVYRTSVSFEWPRMALDYIMSSSMRSSHKKMARASLGLLNIEHFKNNGLSGIAFL